MTINSEQIQALRAAAESCDKQEPLSLVVYHGKMCLRNKGGIVFTVLRDICFPEYSAENENYARLAELCTPDFILSLLADRDADKALIAEQREHISSLEEGVSMLLAQYDQLGAAIGWTTEKALAGEGNQEQYAESMVKRIAELEARTLTVKLPTKHNNSGFVTDGIWNKAIDECYLAFIEACAAAGITLGVGE
ncbi:hypothetical protein [Citrobacter sp. RHBSTW-00881]|uniref:hypothetical protein n=1 Tax=Citrobacter sp. RHBSTW-00881 TaxID=2742667 RepID=UPI0015E94FB5|nr:hypothetical protein [Citrobacter sp. RHBSTW-00881]QLS66702.1 hypothetical protein HV311_19810 [Citrobacter sp. RHBSTW-00881]